MTSVRNLANDVMNKSVFVQSLKKGTLSRDSLKNYLADIKWILEESVPHITIARNSAERLGDRKLAQFLSEKIVEESGHEVWAYDDLKKMKVSNLADLQPSQGAVDLMQFARTAAKERPEYFVGYMIWSESFTVIAGQEMEQFLPGNKLTTNDLTVIYNHVETDKRHVLEDVEIAANYFSEPLKRKDLIDFISKAADITVRFLDGHVQ